MKKKKKKPSLLSIFPEKELHQPKQKLVFSLQITMLWEVSNGSNETLLFSFSFVRSWLFNWVELPDSSLSFFIELLLSKFHFRVNFELRTSLELMQLLWLGNWVSLDTIETPKNARRSLRTSSNTTKGPRKGDLIDKTAKITGFLSN